MRIGHVVMGRVKFVAPAAANYGLIVGGNGVSVTYMDTVDKYVMSTQVVTGAAAISPGRGNFAGGSNTTQGVVSGGYNGSHQTTVQRFIFSGTTWDSRASLATGTGNNACASNADTMILMGGDNTTTQTRLYSHSGNSWSSGPAVTGQSYVKATSTASDAYLFGGRVPTNPSTQAYSYSYSGNTYSAPRTALAVAVYEHSAAGNLSYAVMAGGTTTGGGNTTAVQKHTYAGNASTTLTSLSRSVNSCAAIYQGIGDATYAAFCGGGYSPLVAEIVRFTFATDTHAVSSGVLRQASRTGAGLSSAPGGL